MKIINSTTIRIEKDLRKLTKDYNTKHITLKVMYVPHTELVRGECYTYWFKNSRGEHFFKPFLVVGITKKKVNIEKIKKELCLERRADFDSKKDALLHLFLHEFYHCLKEKEKGFKNSFEDEGINFAIDLLKKHKQKEVLGNG